MTVSDLDLNPFATQFAHNGTQSASIHSQLIVVETQQQRLAFPSRWIDEVLFFPRQQILDLPFYQRPVLGVVPHHGHLVVVIEYPCNTPQKISPGGGQEYMRALRLSQQLGELAGTAIAINQIIATISETDLDTQGTLECFDPTLISPQSFQPYRWI